MSKNWYKKTTVNGTYFTHKTKFKTTYNVMGDGDKDPTPNQMKVALESTPDSEVEYGKLLCQYNVQEGNSEAIELPPGTYTHYPADRMTGEVPERLVPVELRDDSYIMIGSVYEPLANDLKNFLQGEEIHRKLGIIYKRGVLLYGAPGCGKTTFLREFIKNEAPKDSVTIFFELMPSNDLIATMKASLGDRLKILVFEELCAVVENSRIERVLDFLDGEKSLDKCVIFGTTNYPEKLPGNIVDRPSRFSKCYKFKEPNDKERKVLMDYYLMRSATETEIEITRGMSTAALKEICILSHINGMSVEDAAKMLKAHSELVKNDFAERKSIGFAKSGYFYDED